MAKIIIQNPAPNSARGINRNKHTAAHTCQRCGRHIYGNAAVCPECIMKITEEGARQYGKR